MTEVITYRKALEVILKGLKDEEFQRGLQTSVGNAEGRHLKTLEAYPELRELAKMVEDAKQKVISNIDYYIDLAVESLKKINAEPYVVSDAAEAREVVGKIVGKGKIVIFSKSMVAEELGLQKHLEKLGNEVWETDTGEFLIRLAGTKPMHTTAPAIHLSRERIVKLLREKIGIKLPEDASHEEIVAAIRGFLREKMVKADVGITGANALAADTGSIVLVENESNIRLVTSLPPVHIAIVGIEKIYPSLTIALAAAIVQAAWAGLYPPTYLNVISGPSSTADIERKRVYGAHGPRKVHVILVDNGRRSAAKHSVLKGQLKCVKCGRCQWECPVWQQTANLWGGPVYGGPMGMGWTAITLGVREASELSMLCLNCGRCDQVCPVHVPLTSIIRWLKQQYMGEQ
jgi:L-lactate dehydrogenase complex protein LldG